MIKMYSVNQITCYLFSLPTFSFFHHSFICLFHPPSKLYQSATSICWTFMRRAAVFSSFLCVSAFVKRSEPSFGWGATIYKLNDYYYYVCTYMTGYTIMLEFDQCLLFLWPWGFWMLQCMFVPVHICGWAGLCVCKGERWAHVCYQSL